MADPNIVQHTTTMKESRHDDAPLPPLPCQHEEGSSDALISFSSSFEEDSATRYQGRAIQIQKFSSNRRNGTGSDLTEVTCDNSFLTDLSSSEGLAASPELSKEKNKAVIMTQQESLSPHIIQDWHAVLGDRNSGGKITVATSILRAVKHDFKKKYENRPRSVWFSPAVAEYQARVAKAFPHVPSHDRGLVLVKCTKEVKNSGRVETLNTHCFAGKKALYGTAKLPQALEFYFQSRDPASIESRVQHYRQKLKDLRASECRPPLDMLDEFDDLLSFCERRILLTTSNEKKSIMADNLLKKLNLIPTLKEQWELLQAHKSKITLKSPPPSCTTTKASWNNDDNCLVSSPKCHNMTATNIAGGTELPADSESTKMRNSESRNMRNQHRDSLNVGHPVNTGDYFGQNQSILEQLDGLSLDSSTDWSVVLGNENGEVDIADIGMTKALDDIPLSLPDQGEDAVGCEVGTRTQAGDQARIKTQIFDMLNQVRVLVDRAFGGPLDDTKGTSPLNPQYSSMRQLPSGEANTPTQPQHEAMKPVTESLPGPPPFTSKDEEEQQNLSRASDPLGCLNKLRKLPASPPPISSRRSKQNQTQGEPVIRGIPRSPSSAIEDDEKMQQDNRSMASTASGQKRQRRGRRSPTSRSRRSLSNSSKRSRNDDGSAASLNVPPEIETRRSSTAKEEDGNDDFVDSYGSAQSESSVSTDEDERTPVFLQDGAGRCGLYTGARCCRTGLPHGKGKLVYSKFETEEGIYEGEWNKGLWHGQGYLRDCKKGNIYMGEFKLNRKHGTCTEYFASGSVLEGKYASGRLVSGEMRYPDGSSYSGQWRRGVYHGRGKSIGSDGSVYRGKYVNGHRVKGQIRWSNGTFYRGDWRNGKPHGEGESQMTGFRYKGQYKNGSFHGKGKLEFPDGAWYSGEFDHGMMSGFGRKYDAAGNLVREGFFHESRIIA